MGLIVHHGASMWAFGGMCIEVACVVYAVSMSLIVYEQVVAPTTHHTRWCVCV